MHSLILVSVSCSLKSFNTVSSLKCIKWDCGDQYHRFFGSGARQLSTRQEMNSWPCQMLLRADSVVPVMLGNVGHSGCYQKGFVLMFCLPLHVTGYLFNISSPGSEEGLCPASQLYQLVLPSLIFIGAFLNVTSASSKRCLSYLRCPQVNGWSLVHLTCSWIWSYREEIVFVCS